MLLEVQARLIKLLPDCGVLIQPTVGVTVGAVKAVDAVGAGVGVGVIDGVGVGEGEGVIDIEDIGVGDGMTLFWTTRSMLAITRLTGALNCKVLSPCFSSDKGIVARPLVIP